MAFLQVRNIFDVTVSIFGHVHVRVLLAYDLEIKCLGVSKYLQ